MTLDEFGQWYKKKFRGTSSAGTITATIITDVIGVMLSFGAGFFFVNLYDAPAINFRSFISYWPYLPVFIVIFQMLSLYPGIALAPAEEVRGITIGSFLSFIGIIFSRYVYFEQLDYVSAAFFLSFIFSIFVILICRSVMRLILHGTKLGSIPAVIYGSGEVSKSLIDKLLTKNNLSYIPALIIDDCADYEEYRGVPVLRDIEAASEIVRRFNIKMALVSMADIPDEKLQKLLKTSISAFRYNVLIPSFFNAANIWMKVRDFGGILGFALTNRLRLPFNRFAKRTLDLTLVIAGGLIVSPFLLITALLVKVTSKGAIFYGHERIGRNGKKFKAYKFRSMRQDADIVLKKMLTEDSALRAEWDAHHKLKNDPRITKLGAFLRKTSLDEFPQLWNILKGDMSLVGPRPVVDAEKEKYGGDFERIFSVRPGLTGMWQVSGRSDANYAERVAFDTYYLQSWSIWLDIWVLYKTLGAVLWRRGAY